MTLRTLARLFALSCTAVTGTAAAQINLPAARLPPLPATGLTNALGHGASGVTGLAPEALTSVRRTSGSTSSSTTPAHSRTSSRGRARATR